MECVLVDPARARDDLAVVRHQALGTGQSGTIAAFALTGILAVGVSGVASRARRHAGQPINMNRVAAAGASRQWLYASSFRHEIEELRIRAPRIVGIWGEPGSSF
ncbi:hypothetical protein [Mycobacterium sp. URHB0021]